MRLVQLKLWKSGPVNDRPRPRYISRVPSWNWDNTEKEHVFCAGTRNLRVEFRKNRTTGTGLPPWDRQTLRRTAEEKSSFRKQDLATSGLLRCRSLWDRLDFTRLFLTMTLWPTIFVSSYYAKTLYSSNNNHNQWRTLRRDQERRDQAL